MCVSKGSGSDDGDAQARHTLTAWTSPPCLHFIFHLINNPRDDLRDDAKQTGICCTNAATCSASSSCLSFSPPDFSTHILFLQPLPRIPNSAKHFNQQTMGAVETPRQLVGAAIQEFFGALLMFLVLWPFVGVFGNTWTAWLAHFFFVMLVREERGGREDEGGRKEEGRRRRVA